MRKVNKARAKSEEARCYGPPARHKFVTLGPCAACGATELCDNAHVLGNDGAGRKGSFKEIAPLCRPHLRRGETYEGCHAFSHRDPAGFRARYPKFSPTKAAAITERNWRKFLSSAVSPEREPSNG
jgi:hypothetical protein